MCREKVFDFICGPRRSSIAATCNMDGKKAIELFWDPKQRGSQHGDAKKIHV